MTLRRNQKSMSFRTVEAQMELATSASETIRINPQHKAMMKRITNQVLGIKPFGRIGRAPADSSQDAVK